MISVAARCCLLCFPSQELQDFLSAIESLNSTDANGTSYSLVSGDTWWSYFGSSIDCEATFFSCFLVELVAVLIPDWTCV